MPIPQFTFPHIPDFLDNNEDFKHHQSLCYDERTAAFMLDDDTDTQVGCIWSLNSQGTNEYECGVVPSDNTTKILAKVVLKKLAHLRYRIGCSSQEMAQLRNVEDLHICSAQDCSDSGIGLMTWIQICGSVVLASIAVLTLYFLRGWIAAKYHVISMKLF
ncbi:hypothetical protein Ddc_14525 [Ditylenchus destructor]|nr:hypothetical protein Ddc_14525 [Ditylenchus destructor]